MPEAPTQSKRRAPASARPGDATRAPEPAVTEPTPLEIRLFGSFEIQCGGESISALESQSARALLAYLASHPGRPFQRDSLANLLWPDQSEKSARHNLRQALYNLRSSLSSRDGASPVAADHRVVSFEASESVWVDVQAFGEALGTGRGKARSRDPHALTRAVQLYRGDFLSGFYIRDNPAYEEWTLAEQERLREDAVGALRHLVEHHKREGSYPLAIQHARHLLRIEPFSEEAHRQLMQLYALSGRRSRALAHYDEMRRLFQRELGVEPLEETTALYRSLQSEPVAPARTRERAPPEGPQVPLVGRAEAMAALQAVWSSVRRGNCRLTLVEGEGGVGKTRLIRTLLNAVTTAQPALVLQGRSYEMCAARPYQPVAEALRNAVSTESEIADRVLTAAGSRTLAVLQPLIPELGELDPRGGRRRREEAAPTRAGLFSAIARFLELLTDPPTPSRPGRAVVLFVDDLHWADAETCELLESLLDRLAGTPVWILGAYRGAALPPGHRLHSFAASAGTRNGLSHISLERLDSAGLCEVAASLVGKEHAGELARLMARISEGLPLRMTELVNLLWDEGLLTRHADGLWSLADREDVFAELASCDLPALILRRVQRLPRSTRRLLTLAGIAGPTFEASLLETVENEHQVVVETGLSVMLERWLVRQFQRYWADSRRERDLALWAGGARHGIFEFTHKSIRRALYESLDPSRRRALHLQIADTLEVRESEAPGGLTEELAFHFVRAGVWERALPYLERAAEKAARLHAVDTARLYYDDALRAIDELGAEKKPSPELRERRERILRALAKLL